MTRNGSVDKKGRKLPVRIRKQYSFKRNGLELQYDITNTGYEKVSLNFGSEINLSLPDPAVCESKFFAVNEAGEMKEIAAEAGDIRGVKILQVQDVMNNTSIQMEYSALPERCWCLPLETPYTGRGEETLLYQGTTMLPQWNITLFPGESWTVELSLKVGKSSGKAFA